MSKEEFLAGLKSGLAGLPADDVGERLAFYGEMIDDRIEEGLTETEAVEAIGPIDSIVSQTVADVPLTKLVKEKIKPKRKPGATEMVLIVLGFPVWFSLLVAVAAVALSLYIAVWALIVSLWAVEVSVAASALFGFAAAVVSFAKGNAPAGLGLLGTGLVCAGAAILMFFVCRIASKGLIALTKKAAIGIKTRIVRKENTK